MAVEVKEREFPSTDGIHTLKGKMYIPEGQPKGIFHLVHGNTAVDDSELGYIAKKKGWKLLTDDVYVVSVIVKGEYPGLPYYLMGHSMGSFIVRNAAARYPDLMDKLIVMGTGGPMAATKAALDMIARNKLFHGERHVSPLIEKLAFGSYNKGFGDGSNGDWLSTNPEVRQVYDADKFCNYHFTISAMQDLVKLNDIVNRKTWFKKISKTLPIFLLSGADDPVGDYGKGVKKVYKLLKKRKANVTMKLYENNRHEILNDTARDEAIADILAFIGG